MLCGWMNFAEAQGRSWPEGQGSWHWSESKSPVKAKIADPREIKVPGPDVPPSIRGLSGRWIGYGRKGRSLSIAVDVEELTAAGGTVSYAYSDAGSSIWGERFRVWIKGEELEGRYSKDRSGGSGAWFQMRLRSDGDADVMVSNEGGFIPGVMMRSGWPNIETRRQSTIPQARNDLTGKWYGLIDNYSDVDDPRRILTVTMERSKAVCTWDYSRKTVADAASCSVTDGQVNLVTSAGSRVHLSLLGDALQGTFTPKSNKVFQVSMVWASSGR